MHGGSGGLRIMLCSNDSPPALPHIAGHQHRHPRRKLVYKVKTQPKQLSKRASQPSIEMPTLNHGLEKPELASKKLQ